MNAVVEQPDDPRYPATPMQMLQLAISQSTDMERLKTLMDLQERWEANQAKKAFNVALAAFKKNPPVVVKDLLNTQYNSMYTSLGNLVNTVNERLGEYGLSASWDIEQSPETIKVTCILEHVDGHSRRVSIESPPDESGSKNDLQKIRSTLTYLRGSTFEAVTGIASRIGNQDDDGNGAGAVEYITADQVTKMNAALKEVNANVPVFLQWIKAESVEKIKASSFKEAMQAIADKKRKG